MQALSVLTSAVGPGDGPSQVIPPPSTACALTFPSVIALRRIRVALAILLIGVVGCGATTVVDSNAAAVVILGQWLYPALMCGAAVIVAARAWCSREAQWTWWLIAGALMVPTVRNIFYPVLGPLATLRPLWLCFYPLLFAGLLLLLRARLKRLPIALWLDGVIAGSAVAAVAAIASGPYRAATGVSRVQAVLALAFPVGDLLLLAVAVGALSALGSRADRRWVVVAVGFILYAVADILFMVDSANGTYVRGSTWFDVLRPAAALLLAVASWMTPVLRRSHFQPPGGTCGIPQLFFSAILVGILVLGYDFRLPRAAVVLAAVGLVGVTARFAVAFREVRELADCHRHALTDDLTLLANRRAMSAALTAASFEYSTSGVEADRPGPGLLLLDLDDFKRVNDALGHHIGDQLLCQVADRLSQSVRPEDLLARVGGDEFAVLLPPGIELADAEWLAVQIVEALNEPFLLEDMTVHVDASVGVAICPAHCTHPEDLLRCADVAMYQAKGLPSRTASYDSTYDSRRIDERRMIAELRSAITDGQLTCHYQPKIRADDGRVHSVEALVRWQHPRRGVMVPGEFLHYAELGGLMRPLASAVLNVTLRQARIWRERGIEMTVAVNLSATNLLDVDLVTQISNLLRVHGVPGDALILEITEGVLISDSLCSRSVVESLQRLGIRLSIDDFGTGWSSLARLQEMTVDELKLDGVFVARLVEDPRSIAIVRSTVTLAHSLGASLVAEGVEDTETLHALRRYGCDITQGYVHCPPLPADELDLWLSAMVPEVVDGPSLA
jgi:diguanylate cyclase